MLAQFREVRRERTGETSAGQLVHPCFPIDRVQGKLSRTEFCKIWEQNASIVPIRFL